MRTLLQGIQDLDRGTGASQQVEVVELKVIPVELSKKRVTILGTKSFLKTGNLSRTLQKWRSKQTSETNPQRDLFCLFFSPKISLTLSPQISSAVDFFFGRDFPPSLFFPQKKNRHQRTFGTCSGSMTQQTCAWRSIG